MEKLYNVKGVRRTKAFGDTCISATICLGGRPIGSVTDSADTGKPTFEFSLPLDRVMFETFINQWWERTNPLQLYSLEAIAMLAQNPAYVPTLTAKMRYWVQSVAYPSEADRPFKAAA
jgi:hypothetical protein